MALQELVIIYTTSILDDKKHNFYSNFYFFTCMTFIVIFNLELLRLVFSTKFFKKIRKIKSNMFQ